MSIADANDPKRRDQRYHGLLDSVAELSRAAKACGLSRLQVECTPLAREIPYTVEQAKKFLKDIEGRCEIPVTLLVDIGHALYQPLYGPKAKMPEWLNGPLSGWTADLLDQKVPVFSELVDEPRLRQAVSRLTSSKTWDWESVGRIWPYLNMKWMLARYA